MEYNKLLADMVPGDRVEGFYILKEGAIKTSNSGKPFLSATVTDKSGSLDLKAWDYSGPVGAPTDAGKVVKIRADVTEYRGSIQLTASNIRMATQEDSYDVSALVPVAPIDRDETLEKVRSLIASMEDRGITIWLEGTPSNSFDVSSLLCIQEDESYMRDYVFEQGVLKEVHFDKLNEH